MTDSSERQAAIVHIRKRRTTWISDADLKRYSWRPPQKHETLCGAEPTTNDFSYGWAISAGRPTKLAADLECDGCRRAIADLTAKSR